MQRDARVAWIVVLIGIAGSAVLVSACDDEPALIVGSEFR
jgi:hypothetical protein